MLVEQLSVEGDVKCSMALFGHQSGHVMFVKALHVAFPDNRNIRGRGIMK